MDEKVCCKCNVSKPLSEFHKIGSYKRADGTKGQSYRPDCKICANAHWKHRVEEIFEKSGVVWKCTKCGYDKCKSALDLHHLDPLEKDVHVSSMWTYTETRILAEIKKCVVLCANCHREVHAGIAQC